MHIYTPVEIIYSVFLLDFLLFTEKELSPDSVTATLSNTKAVTLQGTVFCNLEKIHQSKETVLLIVPSTNNLHTCIQFPN